MNFWYPVVLGKDLDDKPQKVRMIGQDFVVFRDSAGTANCLANTCTHRGGSLAGGKIKGDCIECPYHGWQFDGQGTCHRIPSLGPDGKIPARTRVDAYPVVEKYGLVFAFLGDLPESERPPMMEIPEFDDEGWRATWLTFDIDYNYERSIENGLDPAHNEFVHPTHGFSGEHSEYRVNEMRWIGDGQWGPGFFHKFKSPGSKDKDFSKMKQATDSREAGSGTIGPNHMWTYIRFAPGKAFHQYMYENPIDEARTRIFLINLRSTFLEPEMDEKVNEKNWMVAKQDIDVLTDLRPTKEFMVPADEPILRYREKLREWDAKGWRIDTDAIRRTGNKVAYAVPSPGRRTAKGWVLDPVPLVSAHEATAQLKVAGEK
jgi:phenylpropionate dioxygenase-like ring-hydroxylating dioxygenase large terminal subunit